MIRTDVDSQVRVRAFEFLAAQRQTHPNAIPWRVLLEGFEYEGRRVPLVSQQGIFRPALRRLPLSIRTAPLVEGRERPYEDEMDRQGLLLYRYRGTDRAHRENEGLRAAMRRKSRSSTSTGSTQAGTSPSARCSWSATIPDGSRSR